MHTNVYNVMHRGDEVHGGGETFPQDINLSVDEANTFSLRCHLTAER